MTNKRNQPSMSGDTGFGMGFFCGMILGAIGVYVTVVPEGKRLKERFITEFHAYKEKMELETNEEQPLYTRIRTLIQKAKQKLNKQVQPTHSRTTASTGSSDKKKHYFKAKP